MPRCPYLIMRYPQGPPPPRRTSLLPIADVADNEETPRYSPLPHVHVALSPGVAQRASPQPSTVPAKKDGQYGSRWSLLPDMPPAKYRKTMRPLHLLSVWPSSHMCVMQPIIITFRDLGLCRAQPVPNATCTSSLLLARSSLCPLCLLHGPPLPISGCWAVQSPAILKNIISCLLGAP